ncbi:hypothetical protein HS048_31795 [Planomonospora sp. ID91781]|uniref:hypothetical protein n=1 Tax=Planomonospora sp. ID91781 TaxID=2738135 RepID=UPI0018C4437E|nr:hypothetical protein [Planomonospora sp. ID91781]MBG0825274.1 hypothetical protein [Planomonospora sp. ID91781]
MFPLRTVAAGFLIALFAIRINGFDLLVDVIGWLLVVLGLSRMEKSVDPVFGKARLSAVAASALSLAALVGLTANVVMGLLYMLSGTITIWLTAEGIISRAQAVGDSSTASTFNALRWVLLAVNVTGVVTFYTGALPSGIALITAVAGVVAVIWFVVRLYMSARLPYLSQPSAPADARE